jgi:hypothetical protein
VVLEAAAQEAGSMSGGEYAAKSHAGIPGSDAAGAARDGGSSAGPEVQFVAAAYGAAIGAAVVAPGAVACSRLAPLANIRRRGGIGWRNAWRRSGWRLIA